jgi:co-chaperonin GroES (HSP10)
MPKPKRYYLKQNEVDNMRIIQPNKVLVEITEKNEDKKTKSGIIMVSPTYRSIERPTMNPVDGHDDFLWRNSNKYGIVRQVPKQLKRYRNHLWSTTVEIQSGDKVWFDAMDGENCDTIITENSLYYLLDYFSLHVARRGDDVVMLNGYTLCTLVDDESSSVLAIKTGKKDARLGVLAYLGSCNKYYYGRLEDDEDLQVGQKVIFNLPPVMLESAYLSAFDGKTQYRISHRFNIVGYFDGDELKATKNHVVVKAEKDSHKGLIEIPAIYRKPNGFGTVIHTKCEDLNIGQKIKFLPKAGLKIEHNGEEFYIFHVDSILVKYL